MATSLSQDEQDTLITQLCQATGLEAQAAAQYLRENEWSLETAANHYYAGQEEEIGDDTEAPSAPTAPQSLGRVNAHRPIPSASSSQPQSQPAGSKKKFATLGDLSKSQGGHGHDHDDDDDDDDEQDLFAGGEKSGLAVQNPDDLRRKLIEKARRAMPRPSGDEDQPPPSHFRGTAHTIGSEDTPSQTIEDPEANHQRPPERVERVLHFWSNGFSIDDGQLYDTSDPQNAMMLEMIRRGRAPLSLMNIQQDQEVDVRLEEHDTPYQAPKKKFTPFGGSGHRLGSPVPGVSTETAPSAVAAEPTTSNAEPPKPNIDDSQPAVSLQIRLADGTRLVTRFNTSSTIQDICDFVQASNAESGTRGWVLMTTFPTKELADKSAKIEDTNELKRGGVVVQKWT